MMKKLKKVIKKHWGVDFKTIDKEMTLMELAIKIACISENCKPEEAFNMYVGHQGLHLPGLIALYIVDEMRLDSRQVKSHMTIGELFDR